MDARRGILPALRRLWRTRVILGAAAGLLPAVAYLHAQAPAERVLARAGSVFISEREFVERFEMVPGLYRHRGSSLEVAKLEFLYALAAEKLLAQEALERGLEEDSLLRAALRNVRGLLARDQLYREEVREKIIVTGTEIAAAMDRAPVLLHVSYLFFQREEDARFVGSRCSSAADFDRLVMDSSMTALRDTATVIWGDADEEIENAAYALTPTGVSPPVRSGEGWYILRLLSTSPRPDFQGLSGAALSERVERSLRERRETVRMHEVLREVLARGTGYAKPAALKTLARAVREVFAEDTTASADSLIIMDAPRAVRVRERCAAALGDTLAVAGDERWTMGDGIALLLHRRFTVPRRNLDATLALINDELEFRVHQEVLAQEALRRGLDERPEVRRRLDLWRDAFLADAMKRHGLAQVTLTEAEIDGYVRFLDTAAAPAEVSLRELRTTTLEEMHAALAELDAGRSFEEIVRRWTVDDSLRSSGGVTGFFPITARQPIGELAGELKVGERFGPVRTEREFVTFEVLARRERMIPPGSAVPSGDSLVEGLRAMKQQGLLNRFLSRSASVRGVDVYQDRLGKVDVSPVPMVTYRLLGFGGRMFEVPFVDPQTQWLRIPPPQEPVIP
jgi:parvulin-like peptidyl-prolyl isomerase